MTDTPQSGGYFRFELPVLLQTYLGVLDVDGSRVHVGTVHVQRVFNGGDVGVVERGEGDVLRVGRPVVRDARTQHVLCENNVGQLAVRET